MTEKQMLVTFLESTGVLYKTFFELEEDYIVVASKYFDDEDFDNQIDKVTGYPGFFTKYTFDKDGKLISMGAYE